MIKTNNSKIAESYKQGWEMAFYRIENNPYAASRGKKAFMKRAKDK